MAIKKRKMNLNKYNGGIYIEEQITDEYDISISQSYSDNRVNIFHAEFEKESDRAAVILSIAMLEQTLETLLKTRLVSISSSEDPFIEGQNAPISTFSAKINLAYRIGLISPQFSRDLHILRKIRNEFAHNVSHCNFENTIVQNRIIELMRSSQIFEKLPSVRDNFKEGVKGDFQVTVAWMLWYLCSLLENTSSITQGETNWEYIL